MKLEKRHIGKYVTRTAPCDYKNGNKDYSYIGEKIKILSIDKKHVRYATKEWKSTLDERWLDDNWKEYEEIIDINNLDLNELYIIQNGLKALVKQNINKGFERLEKISRLGAKIDKQIEVIK